MKIKTSGKTFSFIILLLCAVAFIGCWAGTMETKKETNPEIQQAVSITEADKTIAVEIPSAQNHERGNASGPSIPSGAHSESFPGIVFVWDSKTTNNGYLLAAADVFDKYESFTLTTKEGSGYWDFVIKPETGQQKNKDGNYIFYILRAGGSNKINMVFLSEWLEKEDCPAVIEEEAELFIKLEPDLLSSAIILRVNTIQLYENVVYNFTVDNGNLGILGQSYFNIKNVDVNSGGYVNWYSRITSNNLYECVRNAFIETVVKLDDNIIGYAVIEVFPINDPQSAELIGANVLKSVLFPQVDGAYQNVSEEYVKSEIEKVKAKAQAQVKR